MKELVQAIQSKNSVLSTKLFNTEMVNRIQKIVDNRKIEVGKAIFSEALEPTVKKQVMSISKSSDYMLVDTNTGKVKMTFKKGEMPNSSMKYDKTKDVFMGKETYEKEFK